MKNIKYIIPVVIVMIISGILVYVIQGCSPSRTQSVECTVGFSNTFGNSESGYYVAHITENVNESLTVTDTWHLFKFEWNSKGNLRISADAHYDYYCSLKAFNIKLKNGHCVVEFLPLTAKVRWNNLKEERTRGLSVSSDDLSEALNEFLKKNGEFEKKLEENANSENRIRMAKLYAEDSLKSLLQELIFPLLKIKNIPSENITIRYNADIENGKINVALPSSALMEYEGKHR